MDFLSDPEALRWFGESSGEGGPPGGFLAHPAALGRSAVPLGETGGEKKEAPPEIIRRRRGGHRLADG